MGSEQSTEKEQRDDKHNEEMFQQILEQQRNIYESRCKEMLQQQQRVVTVARVSEEAPARPYVVQNTRQLNTQTATNAYAPLYPNLQETPAHIQNQTSTSRSSYNVGNNQINIGASTSRSNPICNTSYNNLPSAPVAPLAMEPVQSKPRTQNRHQNHNDDWMCISCNRNLGDKIFNCTQGHSSCSDCKFKGIKCGICRNSLTDTRNISLEKYITEVKSNVASNTEVIINCPNKNDGCKLSLKKERMDQHIKECPFREFSCPVASYKITGCLWKGKINHIRDHFLECHPEVTDTDVDTETKMNTINGCQIMHHVVMGSFHFLVHLKLSPQGLYMAVQLIGSYSSASKWTYEFHVYDKSEPRRKYLYTDKCSPNNIPFSTICDESTCAILQYEHAMSFVKGNTLTYKFYIKKEANDVKRGGPRQRGRGRQ